MSEWKECSLGEVLEIKYGKDHKVLADGKVPCLGSGGIMRYVDKSIYESESILIPRKGSLNNIMYQNGPFWTVDTMFWSKINQEKVCGKFLFYQLLLTDYTILNVGSAVPSLTVPVINEIEISLPPLPEQRAIAAILSSLDDKIDLLHRQNATLEKMAETLFRQWFVHRPEPTEDEEAREEWEIVKLKQVVEVGIGRTPPRQQFEWFSNSNIHMKWVSIKDLGDSGIFVFDTSEYLTDEAVEKFSIPVIPENTVLLSFKMTVGRVAITTEPMLSNEAIAHFKFKKDTPFSKEYLYYYLKLYPYDTLGSTSSIVTSINSGMIKELEITIPDEVTMQRFNYLASDYFQKIKSNQIQIRTLTALRDSLLPKLMSGEVRVDSMSVETNFLIT